MTFYSIKKTWLVVGAYLVMLFFTVMRTQAQEYIWSKTLDSQYINTLGVTPSGMFAGENDNSPGVGRFNGVYFSKDLGETWTKAGLDSRGVTELSYDSGKLYATTKYVVNNKVGLFTSVNNGDTWEYVNDTGYSSNNVVAQENTIILGTFNHGLWVSYDAGATWTQKIGTGYYGPTINDVDFSGSLALATTNTDTYISYDSGISWSIVPTFQNIRIKTMDITENVIVVGSDTSEGIYISMDQGETWHNSVSWGKNPTGAVFVFRGNIYASKTSDNGHRTVMVSEDLGKTWVDMNLITNQSLRNVKSFAGLFGDPCFIYAVTDYDGVFKTNLDLLNTNLKQFLSPPWHNKNKQELLDKVTAYFDHKYPLLGYRYKLESLEDSINTTSYLGTATLSENIAYSSHDGYDYALPYDTPVLATHSGFASYYYCKDCGHTIKIDHENGYQTVYMHLQKEGLITETGLPTFVDSGESIGKVGMTGNTTGPHLHFAVIKDKNDNGVFDDFPEGKVDPFGWQSLTEKDPWGIYEWKDALGTHSGSFSKYLWVDELFPTVLNAEKTQDNTIVKENKKVVLGVGSLPSNATILLTPYIKPTLSYVQSNLKYIDNSSIIITATDFIGNKIKTLLNPVEIEIEYSEESIVGIEENTINLYYFNPLIMAWQPLERVILDMISNRIVAKTDHFSNFALFGEQNSVIAPTGEFLISGSKNETGWYTDPPTIEFIGDNPDSTMFYKMGIDIDWQEYTIPTTIIKNGVYAIEYRVIDSMGNITYGESELIKVATEGKTHGSTYITNNNFIVTN